jgi:hypothetical protein
MAESEERERGEVCEEGGEGEREKEQDDEEEEESESEEEWAGDWTAVLEECE